MIHNLVKSIVDVMNVNGNTFTFGHTQQSVQNINADQIQLPVVFLNMPVKYNPKVEQSGFIKTVFTCELFFLYKSNIDDGGGINESGETIAEQQQIEIFEQAFAAHRQFLNLLPKSVDVKEYKSNNAIQIQHVFDADLSGVYATIEIEPVDRSGVCENSLFPVPNCPESGYLIVNENGEVIVQGSLQAGQTLDVTISNSNINVTNSLDQSIGSSVVPAQENQTIQIPDVENIDSDGSIVPTPAGVAFNCSSGSTQLYQGAKVNQTGQTVSYVTGDDITRGRLIDFFTLPYTNEWGHNNRFCGSTGGYADGSNYFDVDGISTTRALAFPDDIVFDFSCRNVDSILSYYIGDIFTTRTYLVACPLYLSSNFGGLTGWNLWNDVEVRNVMCTHYMNTVTHWMSYKPFEFGGGQRYFITSSRVGSQVIRTDLRSISYFAPTTETNPLFTVYVRYTTLTELGL